MHREPSTSELLRAWELGLSRPPVERPIAVLSAVESVERASELPVGRRDARLLTLRRELFGPRLACVTSCPECDEELELAVDVDNLLVADDEEPAPTYSLVEGRHSVTFRLPTTADLVSAAAPDAETMRLGLLERCVIEATAGGEAVEAAELPPSVVAAMSDRMREADPQVEIQLDLHCPTCGHVWQEPLDIGSFVWEELDGWARRLLQDVAALARAFGWTEADVVALSPARRQAYLELAGA